MAAVATVREPYLSLERLCFLEQANQSLVADNQVLRAENLTLRERVSKLQLKNEESASEIQTLSTRFTEEAQKNAILERIRARQTEEIKSQAASVG